MLQFLRSLSRQSNPSTLIAGLLPKFALTHPTFLAEELGEDADPDAAACIGDDGFDENGEINCFSSLNRTS